MEFDLEVDTLCPKRWIGKVAVMTVDGRKLFARVARQFCGHTPHRAGLSALLTASVLNQMIFKTVAHEFVEELAF